MPWRANLSPLSRPLSLPTRQARSASAGTGRLRAKRPLACSSSLVKVFLSTTTAIRGGVNSTGIDQAAAMTLRRPPCSVDTSTVGPWLTRRLAWRSETSRRIEGAQSTLMTRMPTSFPPTLSRTWMVVWRGLNPRGKGRLPRTVS